MAVTISDQLTRLRQIAVIEEVDGDEHLQEPNLIDCIAEAVHGPYSKHRPRIVVEDEAGAGAFDYVVTALAQWIAGFSTIRSIEYPVDDTTQTIDELDPNDWLVYTKNNDVEVIRFKQHEPATGENFRVTYTAPFKFASGASGDSVAIPATDRLAVSWAAASEMFSRMEARSALQEDPSIQADDSNRQTKASLYRSLSSKYMKNFTDFMGVSKGVVAADGEADLDTDLSLLTPHMTHDRRYR